MYRHPLARFLFCSVAIASIYAIPVEASSKETLAVARSGFITTFHERQQGRAPQRPPVALARLVSYPSQVGGLAAYITASPQNGSKHPAIVWISGGDPNTIDDGVSKSAPFGNDQTARQFRNAGIITMYPSLRGGNANPGTREGFFGEIDDIVAAADFLAAQPDVDPARIYLGGHSTGGTLVLLVAEASSRFRAVFAFGPVENAALHQRRNVPLDASNKREMTFRAPVLWLDSVRSPLFIFEGTTGETNNFDSLQVLQKATRNPLIHFHGVAGADHFTDLAPTNALIARKILDDIGASSNIAFSAQELDAPFRH